MIQWIERFAYDSTGIEGFGENKKSGAHRRYPPPFLGTTWSSPVTAVTDSGQRPPSLTGVSHRRD